MKAIEILGTAKTPHITINLDMGLIKIEGRSIPEDPAIFYKQLMNVLDEYIKIPTKPLTMRFDLEYFNTSSAKAFMNIFKKMYDTNLKIEWVYEENDDDIIEAGEDYKMMLAGHLSVELIKKPKV